MKDLFDNFVNVKIVNDTDVGFTYNNTRLK